MNRIIIAFLLLLISPSFTYADDKPITLMADKESYHVGDIIHLKIELPGKGYRLGEVDKKRLEPFEMTSQKEVYNEPSGMTRFIIEGRIFKTGEFTIPPFIIIDSSGKELISDPGLIIVKSLLAKEDEALREMKPQLEVTERGPLWHWILLAIILLISAFLVYRFMAGLKQEDVEAAIPVKAPHEVALEEIVRIEGMNLIREGKIKNHYSLISDVIRTYVGRIQGIDAMEMTTGELMGALKGGGYADAKALEAFLVNCDMVKFAKFRPSDMDMEGLADRARGLVRIIEPCPSSEAEGATVAS